MPIFHFTGTQASITTKWGKWSKGDTKKVTNKTEAKWLGAREDFEKVTSKQRGRTESVHRHNSGEENS